MVKFVLLGGYAHKASDGGRAFYRELVAGYPSPRVLMCYFARPIEQWEKTFAEDILTFASCLDGAGPNFVLARKEEFIEQLKEADVLYLKGGDTKMLADSLASSPGWEKLLTGKCCAGTSAGAEVIAKYSYNLDYLSFYEGMGLLPVKILVHYRSDYLPNIDWEEITNQTNAFHPDLPLITLREGEFKTFTNETS